MADYSAPGISGAAGGPIGGANAPDTEEPGYSVDKLRRQYLDFLNVKQEEINEQRIARHYFHNDQLTPSELNTLKKRGQPAVIRNVIDRKINAVVGLAERLRQDPKAFPRTPTEDERGGAELATATIRYVLDKPNDDDSDWPATKAEAVRNGAINGIFGVELALEKGDHGDPDVTYAIVDPDTFFYDPRSWRYSFSDAQFMGVAKYVDMDVAKRMFPDKVDVIDTLGSTNAGMSGVVSDQQIDREFKWIDTTLGRIFLVEHWHKGKGGEWQWCIYCGDTELARGPSPFYDEKGKTISRYVMASINIDHDGDRYGYVRPLKSRQDEINARGSKALHLLNTRRVKMEKGAVDSVDVLRSEMVRSDGVIVRNPGKELEWDDDKNAQDFAGQLTLMQEVMTEVENFGPNPALIGQGIENKSGRAIALLQQAGIAELGPGFLVIRGWSLRVYRAIWNAVQRHWTAERWIRVTDDEGMAQFIALNRMAMGPDGMPTMVNKLGALDVDIILDEGPDTINLMQDTYDTLTALSQRGQAVPIEILLELAPLPPDTKRKLLAKAEEAKQQSPFDQAIMQGKAEELKLDNDKTLAETQKIRAGIPGEQATAMRNRAGAYKDVASAAVDIAHARRPDMPMGDDGGEMDGRTGMDWRRMARPGDEARPSDGGIGDY